jgi:hypothetical protein
LSKITNCSSSIAGGQCNTVLSYKACHIRW